MATILWAMQEAARAFLDYEGDQIKLDGIKLSEGSRKRIKESMRTDH